MDGPVQRYCTAFEGSRRIASGMLAQVALKTKKVIDRGERAPVLIFDDATGEQIEVDFRGTDADVLSRLGETAREGKEVPAAQAQAVEPSRRGPGRPNLGVVAREVTLLPRHWDWLSSQPGGASVALRKLVEDARRVHKERDRTRRLREAAYRFMVAMAGNRSGFEEATRALFGGDGTRLEAIISGWPRDIRTYVLRLVQDGARPQAADTQASRVLTPRSESL